MLVNAMKAVAKARRREVAAILVEECNLMSDAFLDLLNAVAQLLKPQGRRLPFGGVRIILVGDMHQLAPKPQLQPSDKPGGNPKRDPAGYLFPKRLWCVHESMHVRLLLLVSTDGGYRLLNSLQISSSGNVDGQLVLCQAQHKQPTVAPTAVDSA